MKNLKRTFMLLAGAIILLSNSIKAQPGLTMSINSGAGVICKPGTVTLLATAYSGYGCISASAVALEYSQDGINGWSPIKTYTGNPQFIPYNGYTYWATFSDNISTLNSNTGYYRFRIIGFWSGYCGFCQIWCPPNAIYSPSIYVMFLYNNAGPDKIYAPACGGRVQIGTATKPNMGCSATYDWTPTTDLKTSQTGGNCNPCHLAKPWVEGPLLGSQIYNRQMTCGGNICNDEVTVTYSPIGCRTALNVDDDIQISPNPSMGHFSISANNKIGEIWIYNSVGNIVKHINSVESSQEVFIEAPGIYHLRIANEKGVRSSTLVVN